MKIALEGILTEALGLAISKARANAIFKSTAANVPRIPVNNDATLGAAEVYARFPRNVLDGPAFAKSRNPYVSCYLPNPIYAMQSHENVVPNRPLSAYARENVIAFNNLRAKLRSCQNHQVLS
jgi:hypothetical protein